MEVSGGDRKPDEKVNWAPCGGGQNTVIFLLVDQRYGNHVGDGDCVSGSVQYVMGLPLGK